MLTPLPPTTPLRRELARARITHLDLALRCGVSLSTVSLAARGMPLSPRMAARFAAALGIAPEALLPDASPAPASAPAPRRDLPH